MAGAGYKLFASGDVLTAAQVNTYLNEQTVMVFATSAARTSALSAVLAEGMMSYLQDSNTVFYYDGAAWNALASGDITAITAGNGISVTSGTGPVPTVAIDTAVTVDKTTAQTLTNKTLTTPIISSISNTGTLTLPTSTDTLVGRATTDTLTNKTLTSPALTTPTISTLTTNGDLVYGTGSGALSRLGIGSSAQVLTVASGVPSWATPAGGGGKLLQLVQASYSTATTFSSTTFTDTGLSVSITPTLNTSKILVFINQQLYILATSGGVLTSTLRIVRDATAVFDVQSNQQAAGFSVAPAGRYDYQTVIPLTYLDSPATTSSVTYKTQGRLLSTGGGAQLNYQQGSTGISVITLMEIGA